MRQTFARRGVALRKTPSYRQEAQRRRLMVICAVVGLAVVSGLVGALTHSMPELVGKATTGPFSYTPSQ